MHVLISCMDECDWLRLVKQHIVRTYNKTCEYVALVICQMSISIIKQYRVYLGIPANSQFLVAYLAFSAHATQLLNDRDTLTSRCLACASAKLILAVYSWSRRCAGVHEGLNASADSFFSSQGRPDPHFDDRNTEVIDRLLALHPHASSLEMETFYLLHLANCSRGAPAVIFWGFQVSRTLTPAQTSCHLSTGGMCWKSMLAA
jgi:hypothetical protein